MKKQVKALWKLCFGDDSDTFTDMYFKLRYTDEVNIALENEGEVISALQMFPYPMTFCGHIVPTSYISGACTHPDFRGNGVMRDLLIRAFEKMLEKKIHFSTLIPAEPWLFDYYKRLGYAPVFQYSTQEVVVTQRITLPSINVVEVSEYKDFVYEYLNKKLAERSCCIQHTQEDFKVIMADLTVNGGCLLIAEQDYVVQGIALFYFKKGYTEINECFAESEEVEKSLLSYFHQYICDDRLVRLSPADKTQDNLSLGMARIIHVQEVLQLYAATFPKHEMQIELSDNSLPVNNGYYQLSKGECVYSSKPVSGTFVSLNISELTEKILAPLYPYMSLMLN